MSYIFSRALVEEFLQANYSVSPLSAPLNKTSIVSMFLCKDKTIECSHVSRYGMTYALLGEHRGVELWTWFLEDSPAKLLVQQPEVEIGLSETFGPKCDELFVRYVQSLYLLKMFPKKPYWRRKPIFWQTDTVPSIQKARRQSWVQIIYGKDFGYLHTPTCTANFAATSMQKHRSCRNFIQVFGKPSPMNYEHLMGWPIGWTDLKPLEMDKYRLWRQWHFSSFT